MAQNSKEEPKKSRRLKKQTQTVRQRTQKADERKPRRLRTTASRVADPVKKLGLGDLYQRASSGKLGKILRFPFKLIPNFMKEAWNEVRQVSWPNARQTVRLTIAVFIFAVIFAVIVGILDYFLDKIFREVIIG